MGRIIKEFSIHGKIRRVGPQFDPRFTLHRRQPRSDKLDAQQRRLCHADPAFLDALKARVANSARFAAFLDGIVFYIDLERPCRRCGNFKKRVRDRSCYACHIGRGEENFERMKAGVAPIARRSRDGHLDLLERERAERRGEYQEQVFNGLVARRSPTGRLEIVFPDGYIERDLAHLSYQGLCQAIVEFPALREALLWAGWTAPYDDTV